MVGVKALFTGSDNAETILSAGKPDSIEPATRDMVNCSKKLGRYPIRVVCCSPAAKSPEKLCHRRVRNNQYEHAATRGLNPEAGRELFRNKGIFAGTESITDYTMRATPALKLVAADSRTV